MFFKLNKNKFIINGVGIDGLDLLCERLEGEAVLLLRLGGFGGFVALDDIRLLDSVADAIDDFVAAAERAANVGKMGCGIDFCHSIQEVLLYLCLCFSASFFRADGIRRR